MNLSRYFHYFLNICRLYWKYFVIIGVPLLLLPLAVSGNKAMQCGYIIGIISSFWITEAMELPVTSFIPFILFPSFGILTPSKVANCYMKDIALLLVGGMAVAITFEKQNLHRRLGLNILKLMGPNPIFQYMGFMLSTWFLSMWISNTASTAMMISFADSFVEQWKTPVIDRHHGKVTIIVDKLASLKPVDKAEIQIDEISRNEDHNTDRLTKGLYLSIAYAATCGGIATLTGTGTNLIFYGFMEERYKSKLNLNFGTFMLFSLPLSILILIIIWFITCNQYVGLSTILKRKVDDISRNQKTISFIDKELAAIGPISYGEMSTLIIFILLVLLWVFREPGVPLLGAIFTYKNSKGESVKYWTDSLSAILAALAVFNLPAKNPFKNKGNVETLMDWKYIEKKFPWGLIFLFGGGFALAAGCEASGLSSSIGDMLTNMKNLSQFFILFIVSVGISFLTEITSNTATVTIILPLMLQMSECIGMHPMRMGLAVTIASSFSFCLPSATPPNAIIFSTGKLRVIDMVTSGFLLNFVSVILLSIVAYYYTIPIFHTDVFPDWIKVNCSEIQNSTNKV